MKSILGVLVSTGRDVVFPARSREGKANIMSHSHRQGWLLPLRCNCNGNAKTICIKGPYARIDGKSKKNRVMQGSGRSCAQTRKSKADAY